MKILIFLGLLFFVFKIEAASYGGYKYDQPKVPFDIESNPQQESNVQEAENPEPIEPSNDGEQSVESNNQEEESNLEPEYNQQTAEIEIQDAPGYEEQPIQESESDNLDSDANNEPSAEPEQAESDSNAEVSADVNDSSYADHSQDGYNYEPPVNAITYAPPLPGQLAIEEAFKHQELGSEQKPHRQGAVKRVKLKGLENVAKVAELLISSLSSTPSPLPLTSSTTTTTTTTPPPPPPPPPPCGENARDWRTVVMERSEKRIDSRRTSEYAEVGADKNYFEGGADSNVQKE